MTAAAYTARALERLHADTAEARRLRDAVRDRYYGMPTSPETTVKRFRDQADQIALELARHITEGDRMATEALYKAALSWAIEQVPNTVLAALHTGSIAAQTLRDNATRAVRTGIGHIEAHVAACILADEVGIDAGQLHHGALAVANIARRADQESGRS